MVTVPIERLNSEVFRYNPGTTSGGIYNCRKIAGTNIWSQHAWGNALDVMVPDLATGDRVYAWLALNGARLGIHRIGWRRRWALWRVKNHFDHLHIEGSPKRLGTPPCAGGTVPSPPEEDDMRRGDQGADVARYQDTLRDVGYDPGTSDGSYGPATAAATAACQQFIGFTVNGDVASAPFMASVFARQLQGAGPPGPKGPPGAKGDPGPRGPAGPPGPSPSSATFSY